MRDFLNDKILRLITPARIALFFSAWGLYLRYRYRESWPLAVDEIWQTQIIDRSFLELIAYLPKKAYCSYISADYYLTWPFFQIFGTNKWGLAIPHIISTLFGFYLLYLVCRMFLKGRLGYLVTYAVFCFNATLIWHAFEIRTYAVLPTLALASFYFVGILVDDYKRVGKVKKLAMGSFFVLTIWFHVYGIVMVFFTCLYWLGSKLRDDNFKRTFSDLAKFFSVVLIIAMPLWCYSVFGPHLNYVSTGVFVWIPNPLTDIIGFLKAIFGNLLGYKKLYFLYLGFLLSFLLPHNNRYKQIALFSFMIIIPIQLMLLADLKNNYYFVQRQFVWTIPFMAILLGWSWESCLGFLNDKFGLTKRLMENRKNDGGKT